MRFIFSSDLHGRLNRYQALFRVMAEERPDAVLLGGDLLPQELDRHVGLPDSGGDFVGDYLVRAFRRLADGLGGDYPQVLVIMGNDDPRANETAMLAGDADGLWTYVNQRRALVGDVPVYGYCFVPPTPFLLKDWERYDVSRFVSPGCVSPEEGYRSVPVPENVARHATMSQDLDGLTGGHDLSAAVMLFHAPPYDTCLDRAALDDRYVDHVPLDVHVGSIAIRRFIEARQPCVTLHGHVHESVQLTGKWRERLGDTHAFGGAHRGPELALVRFDPEHPETATRELLLA